MSKILSFVTSYVSYSLLLYNFKGGKQKCYNNPGKRACRQKGDTVTSRERVERTVNRQTPDRIPVDLGGMKASGISVFAYNRLKKYLGLSGTPKVLDARFMLAAVEEEVRHRFHIDVMPLDIENALWWTRNEEWLPEKLHDGTVVLFPPHTKIRKEPDGVWILLNQDNTPTSYRMPKGGFYFDDISFNKTGKKFNPSDFRPSSTIPDEHLDSVSRYGRYLYQNTDYGLLGWGCGVCFLGLSLITNSADNVTMGMPDEWMVMLMTEKDTCHEMMDRSVEASIGCLKLLREAVGDYCFAWGIAADDSGTQRREFINPDLSAEMLKPHYKKLCSWIHKNTGWKTFLHSCGSVYNLIPHFIDAGVDILNPVQTSAEGMSPERLKSEFGDKLIFWGGGCDTQNVLGRATPEEIRLHVRKRMEIFAKGGGYVFNQVHNIQANVPPENIVAMFDAAHEYGTC